MDITAQVIEKASNLCGVLLKNYGSKINTAYLGADDELALALKLTFKPMGSGVKVKADLSFVAERVKDSATETVMPGQQLGLFQPSKDVCREVKAGITEGDRRRRRWYGGR